MLNLRLCVFVFVNLFVIAGSSIPAEILCANPSCTEPISTALGSVTYASSSRNVLSFKPGQEMIIISKSKNKNDYWGAIINGRTGYVPSNLVKEIRAYRKFEDLIPVVINSSENTGAADRKDNKIVEPEHNETLNKNLPEKAQQYSASSSQTVSPDLEKASDNPDLKASNFAKGTGGELLIEPQVKELKSENKVASTKTYNVVEGTTVFVDGSDQITPSATVDVKENSQTSIPVVKTEKETERAEIPPSIINLNSNYEGQLSLNKNVTVENEDDEDDEEEDDDEIVEEDELSENEIYDEEDELGEVLEETNQKVNSGQKDNLMIPQVNPDTMIDNSTEPLKDSVKKSDTMTQSSTQLYDTVIQEIKKENHAETETVSAVNVIESSVTYKTSALLESNDQEQNKTSDTVSEKYDDLELENKKNAEQKTDNINVPSSNPTSFNYIKDKNDIKANNVYSNNNVPSENVVTTLNTQQQAVPETANILNQFSVYADNLQNSSEEKSVNPEAEEVKFNTEKIDSTSQPSVQRFSQGFENIAAEATTEQSYQNEIHLAKEIKEQIGNSVPVQDTVTNVPEKVTEEFANSLPSLDIVTEAPKISEEVFIPPPAVVPESPQLNLENKVAPDTVTEKVEDMTVQPDTGSERSGFFSQIAEVFSGWFGSTDGSNNEKASLDSTVTEDVQKISIEQPSLSSSEVVTDTCQNPAVNCNSYAAGEQGSLWSSWFPSVFNINGAPTSSNTFLYLVVTAVTVLLFTLGHNFIEKKGKTGPLIAKINKLEQELMITSKECCLLKDELQNAKDKIILYENSANDELVISLQAELEEAKKAKLELESSNEMLQQELDAATEAGLDLNKMLSEVLTQKGGSESLLESVESLQAQLNSQQKVIDEMTKKLGVKNQENETLQTALETANEKAENLEGELNDLKQNLNMHLKEKENVTQDLKSQINHLQDRINQLGENKKSEMLKFKKNIEELQKKYSESSKSLAIKEEEFKALKEAVKSLKTKGNVNLESVFDVSRFKAELAVSVKDNDALRTSLKEFECVKKNLEDQITSLDAEIQNLKKGYEEAELKKEEAEKKLDVLSNYFKEKETQLQKELGLQEALWAQKKGDEKAVYNMMKSLQEEVESYRSQNETLKKEILDQERGLKNQIATLEQKAHDNWVAARQAERKLDESKQEMAQLRNRLTLIEKSNSNVEGKVNHRGSEELNGEPTSPILHDASSPLLFPPIPLDPNSSSLLPPGFMPHPMFMPPPVAGFIPPPPFLPGDRRPPPLGRMSSPPLNSRFSPSSPADYPFERMSSPPLSPPARNYRSPTEADREHFRHRTPPYPPSHRRNWDENNEGPGFIPISSQRDSIREPKGSNISSGHSSSDSLEKSSRHSGRV